MSIHPHPVEVNYLDVLLRYDDISPHVFTILVWVNLAKSRFAGSRRPSPQVPRVSLRASSMRVCNDATQHKNAALEIEKLKGADLRLRVGQQGILTLALPDHPA